MTEKIIHNNGAPRTARRARSRFLGGKAALAAFSSIGPSWVVAVAVALTSCLCPSLGTTAEDDLFGAPATSDADTSSLDGFFEPTHEEASASESPNEDAPRRSQSSKKIEPLDDFAKAIALAQLEQRPMLAVLGAKWCSWCRTLESDLGAPEAEEILKRWIVVKVDVDESPELASKLAAHALPGLRILGRDQAAVASKEGYLPPAELKAWLDANLSIADPVVQRELYATGQLDQHALERLGDLLGHRAPEVRLAAQARLAANRSGAAGFVVDRLRRGSLAQQLSAVEILRQWNAPVAELDPWRPETLHEISLGPLLDWLRSDEVSSPDSGEDVPPPDAPVVDPVEAAERLRDLLHADADNRQAALTRAVQIGKTLAADVRLQLAGGEELSDAQRTNLRELLYRVLVGPRVGLEQSSLLTALASLDAETHRQAARSLFDNLTSQDQLLLDELSVDPDAQIRELVVGRLQHIGALQETQRLKRLLADESPAVRTAVLRQLAEHPDEQSIETLVDYLHAETDEDLLVYATKTLGQLGSTGRAEEALIELVASPGWRIRAAALDAIADRLKSGHGNVYGSSEGSSTVSPPLAKAILNSADDFDPFVAKKAAPLLRHVVSKDSAPEVMHYLQSRPERMAELADDVGKYGDQDAIQPLIDYAQTWLIDGTNDQIASAAALIGKLAPTKLRDNLPRLLQSPNRDTRLVAIRALLAALKEFRNKEIERLHEQFVMQRVVSSPTAPWHATPESFQSLPEAPEGSEGELSDEEAEPSQTGIRGFFETLFGGSSDEAPASEQSGPVDENDPSEDDLDLADSLFGELPTDEATDETDDGESSRPNENAPTTSLPSEWLEAWHASEKSRRRPRWVNECSEALAPRLEQLISATDASSSTVEHETELQWVGLGLLACGALHEPSFDRSSLSSGKSLIAIEEILPWLPEAERMLALRSGNINFAEWKLPKTRKVLAAATEIDSREVAGWIFDGFADVAPEDAADLKDVSDILLRALVGMLQERAIPMIQSDDLPSSSDAFLDFSPRRQLPGQAESVAWLSERYQATESPTLRAALLTGLSHLDHRLATQTSVGRIVSAASYDASVEKALDIALADKQRHSVDRAVQLLEHALPEVRHTALERLTNSGREFAEKRFKRGAPLYFDARDNFPGIWYANRIVPFHALKAELTSSNEELRQNARVVSWATSAPADESELVLEGVNGEKERLLMIAALAKAKRTDDRAVEFYRNSIASLQSPAIVYAMLRKLPGEELQAIRSQMRKQFGRNALTP